MSSNHPELDDAEHHAHAMERVCRRNYFVYSMLMELIEHCHQHNLSVPERIGQWHDGQKLLKEPPDHAEIAKVNARVAVLRAKYGA